MAEPGQDRAIVGSAARKLRLALGVAFLSAALTACGGGDGDSPTAANATSTTGAVGGAGVGGAAGVGAAGVVPVGGVAPAGDAAGAGGTAVDDNLQAGDGDQNPRAGEHARNIDTADVPTDAAAPGAITLSWTPPTANEDGTPLDLKGYRIYWGQKKGHYTNHVTIENPGLTRFVVEGLEPATWYVVATALSDHGESEFSNVLTMRVR